MPRPASRSSSRTRSPAPRAAPAAPAAAPAVSSAPSVNVGLGFGDALKWGAGTAIGQRAVDAVFGARESKVEVREVKVATQCPEYGEKKATMHACIETGRNCAAEIKAFERCIDGKQ